MESVKKTLISEIEELQDALALLLERVKNDQELNRFNIISANQINVAIGRYQALMDKTIE